MLIKLNKKVIDVTDEEKEEKDFDPIYFSISCIGYGLVLWIMDIVCYSFFYIHPFPFLSWLFHGISGIAGLF